MFMRWALFSRTPESFFVFYSTIRLELLARMPSLLREPGTPRCRCDRHWLTELRTPSLRSRWADEEGIKWGWRTSGKAFWFLCDFCHKQAWPADSRSNNGASHPGQSLWQGVMAGSHGSRRRLLTGDFYLTSAPPEFLDRPCARPRRPPQPLLRRRSRTPPRMPSSSSWLRRFCLGLRVAWADGRLWHYQVGVRYQNDALVCGLEASRACIPLERVVPRGETLGPAQC